ncbi:MAG: pentapeptide repeat-containing protein [Saccharothrix sp.]|nr:pentapeptide repeat-containing protein [Saccharothrix sp.]
MTIWLLASYGNGGGSADAHRNQLDAIRTAGTIVIGTGGAVALLLAARRQRSTEIALHQKDLDLQHQLRVAQATEADAAARRITDLYTKAAESLDSDKAPVRLAGVYALERVAQDNEGQRQTIVNLLCAYLRMPFDLPAEGAGEGNPAALLEYRQEKEVRVAVQRVLVKHLDPGDEIDQPAETFWAKMELDLAGATLIDLDFRGCHVEVARFHASRFCGLTRFNHSRFHAAEFDQATFEGETVFDGATFHRVSSFEGVRFDKGLWFRDSAFTGTVAMFSNAVFGLGASFSGTRFSGGAYFDGVEFHGDAVFTGADLALYSRFDNSEFRRRVSFAEATFGSLAAFDGARFTGTTESVTSNDDGSVADPSVFWPTSGLTAANLGDHALRRARRALDDLAVVRFEKARFDQDVSFRNAYFGSSVSFVETVFADAVRLSGQPGRFAGVHFEQGVPVELTGGRWQGLVEGPMPPEREVPGEYDEGHDEVP